MRQGEDGLGRENYLNGDLETKRSTGFLGIGSLRTLHKGSGTNKQGPNHPGLCQLLEGLRIIFRTNKNQEAFEGI